MSTSLDKPLSAMVEEWRRDSLTREFTAEEYKKILDTVRSGRIAAGKVAVAKRSSKEPIDTAGLMNELDDL